MTALVLLTLLSATVPLDDDPAFVEAQRLYQDLEVEQAIFKLQEAALEQDRTPADQARVQAWLGVCYGQIGDFDGARRSFEHAVVQDVDVKLEARVAPKLQQLLETARAARQEELKAEAEAAKSAPPKEEPPAPVDDAPKTTTAPPDAAEPIGTGALGYTGYGLLGVGAVMFIGFVVAGAGIGSYGLYAYTIASDINTKQQEALDNHALANQLLLVAGATAGIGAAALIALGGSGGALIALD